MVPSSIRSATRRMAARLRAFELDRRLAAGESEDRDPRLAERARVLTGAKTRERLAQALREVVSAAEDPRVATGGVPLARAEVRAASHQLRLLAGGLQAPGPVHARGVAETQLLLTDGSGPIYNPRSETPLEVATVAARRALASASEPAAISGAAEHPAAPPRPPEPRSPAARATPCP